MIASAVTSPWRGASFADPARLELVKWLAVLAMVCDHSALVLFPSELWLRQIGNFAFPAFALSFGIGLAASSDPLRVFYRLLLPATVAQACWLLLGVGPQGPNILFMFAACALAAALGSARAPLSLQALSVPIVLLMLYLRVEGSVMGFALVLGAFVAARHSYWWMFPASALWVVLMPSLGAVLGVLAVLFAPRLSRPLPHKPGALAWVYVLHLAILLVLSL